MDIHYDCKAYTCRFYKYTKAVKISRLKTGYYHCEDCINLVPKYIPFKQLNQYLKTKYKSNDNM